MRLLIKKNSISKSLIHICVIYVRHLTLRIFGFIRDERVLKYQKLLNIQKILTLCIKLRMLKTTKSIFSLHLSYKRQKGLKHLAVLLCTAIESCGQPHLSSSFTFYYILLLSQSPTDVRTTTEG